MKSGLQAREGLHLNAYLIIRAILETVAAHNSIFQQFPQKAAHHGKCTLGADLFGARTKGV